MIVADQLFALERCIQSQRELAKRWHEMGEAPCCCLPTGDEMSRNELKRWRCQDCSTISPEPTLLTAPNPFDPADTVTGCPHCKSVAQFDEICDEPGCNREAGCGFPAGPEFGGYRRTCSEHSEWGQARVRAAAIRARSQEG